MSREAALGAEPARVPEAPVCLCGGDRVPQVLAAAGSLERRPSFRSQSCPSKLLPPAPGSAVCLTLFSDSGNPNSRSPGVCCRPQGAGVALPPPRPHQCSGPPPGPRRPVDERPSGRKPRSAQGGGLGAVSLAAGAGLACGSQPQLGGSGDTGRRGALPTLPRRSPPVRPEPRTEPLPP